MLGMRTSRSRSARACGSTPTTAVARSGGGGSAAAGSVSWSSRRSGTAPMLRGGEGRAVVQDRHRGPITGGTGRTGRRRLARMSRFLATLLATAAGSAHGMTSGDPHAPVRRTWPEVHDAAQRAAAGLRAAGVGPGSAVGVLAGEPGAIAPAVQAVWLVGGSVT